MSASTRKGLLRQGDVLLIPVDGVRDGVTISEPGSRIVLAEGEATGHAHAVLAEEAELIEARDGTLYLRVGDQGTAELVHEEHDAIPLAAGAYEVRRQREYVPATHRGATVRRVSD